MYINDISINTINKNLNSELLFKQEQFNDFNPNISNKIGNETFYNSTRFIKKI